MKIAIIAPGNLPVPALDGGAVETLIDTFISREKEKGQNTVDVYSVSYGISSIREVSDGRIKYIQFPEKKKDDSKLLRLFCKVDPLFKYRKYVGSVCDYLKKSKYDAVIVENRPTFIFSIAKHTEASIYLHLHNENFRAVKEFCKNVPQYCTGILTVSNYIKRVVEENMANANNVKVLHNGIETSKFRKETNLNKRRNVRKKYNIEENEIVLCYTGRFSPEKGVLEVVKAFSKLNDLNHIVLLIIGSSWFGTNQKSEYVEEVEKEAIRCRNKIIFTGYVKNEEVALIESVCDIAVLPSLWNDPLPLTIIEAMASGLPVITTCAGGIPEMCTSDTGILLKRGENLPDKIERSIRDLIDDEALREKMGKSARSRVEQYFTVDTYYDNFIRILQDTISEDKNGK